jgi:hypothetical protein
MNQVLDLIEALEQTEATDAGDRKIVWRLTEAHTNSPPFTVVASAYPVHPEVSVVMEANRVTSRFASEVGALLRDGVVSGFILEDARAPISRLLDRTLNGVGRVDINLDDETPISVQPQSARAAKLAIERRLLEAEGQQPDWKRSEFGTVEGEIVALHGGTPSPPCNF